MDEQTYLNHWIDRFSDEAKSEIAPDWSKNKSEDLNQSFRQKVITQLCHAIKPAPSLALALLEAETAYCEESESASRDLSLLGPMTTSLRKRPTFLLHFFSTLFEFP